MRRRHIRLFMLAGAVALSSAGCSDENSRTELNPDGPPMVRQVFVQEAVSFMPRREKLQLAFGDHPDIPLVDEDPLNGDDREVNAAIARGTAKIRIVLDEIVRGNDIEELACADGTYSTVPNGSTPDDIKKCAGPPESLIDCEAVCIGDMGPVGVLDENEDGAADDLRMIDYGGGELAASVECGGQMMPLDRENSFYNPSGNQLLPAVPPPSIGPEDIVGLGPALVLVPIEGMRTGSQCTVTFRPEVVDKDGNTVCAPEGGDIDAPCSEGDTSKISFSVEPLAFMPNGTSPREGEQNVDLDSVITLQFVAGIDAATVGAITLADTATMTPVAITVEVQADDESILSITPDAPLAPSTEYVLTITTDLTDLFGGPLPQEITLTFTTAAA